MIKLRNFLIIIFLTCQTNFTLAFDLKTNLQRCIEKNIENIKTFKIPIEPNFSYLPVKLTENLKQNLLMLNPDIDLEKYSVMTIGDILDDMKYSDSLHIERMKKFYNIGGFSTEDSKKLETYFEIYGNILEGYPDLLNEISEDVCNMQGVY